MPSADAIAAFTLVFFAGMVWLRTRIHYRRPRARLTLSRAGALYFVGVVAVLGAGWVLAPPAAQALWPGALTTPLLARVVWFLGTYYLFIPVHRVLQAQGVAVFRAADAL